MLESKRSTLEHNEKAREEAQRKAEQLEEPLNKKEKDSKNSTKA